MRRSVRSAVLVVVVLVLALAGVASASQDNWRVLIGADNGALGYHSLLAHAGVYPGASDGYNSFIGDVMEDGDPYFGFTSDFPGTAMQVAAAVRGESDVYFKNIQAPTMPSPMKTWDMYVAANINSQAGVIRPYCKAVSGETYLPTPTYAGMQARYYIALTDNKGMLGAPANGTRWEIARPAVFSNGMTLWTCPVNLPVIKLSSATNAALIAEGYKLQFVQEVVPEPASILALGGGLLGLAGCAIRRRRA